MDHVKQQQREIEERYPDLFRSARKADQAQAGVICSSAKGEGVWVVVKAKPGQEIRAKGELERQRFEVYLPMRLFENRQGEMRATPLLPPYLFARVPLCVEEWQSIYSTYGVAGVLGFSRDRAFGIADREVVKLKAREDAGYIRIGLAEDQPPPKISAGDRVVVDDWIDAVVLEKVDAKRALILVSLFGRDSQQTIDIKRLAAKAAK